MKDKTPVEVVENVLDALYEFAVLHATEAWEEHFDEIMTVFEENDEDDPIYYALEHLKLLMEYANAP